MLLYMANIYIYRESCPVLLYMAKKKIYIYIYIYREREREREKERELPSAAIHGKYIYIYIERELPSAVIHGKYICIERAAQCCYTWQIYMYRESCPVLLYMANIYV